MNTFRNMFNRSQRDTVLLLLTHWCSGSMDKVSEVTAFQVKSNHNVRYIDITKGGKSTYNFGGRDAIIVIRLVRLFALLRSESSLKLHYY